MISLRFEAAILTSFPHLSDMEDVPDMFHGTTVTAREWLTDEYLRTLTPETVFDLLQDDDWNDFQHYLAAYIASGKIAPMEAVRLKFRDKPAVIDAINEAIYDVWQYQREENAR